MIDFDFPSSSEATSSTSGTNLPGSVPSYDGIKAPAHASINDDTVKKIKKSKKIVRTGGGQIWEDPSLKEWDVNDFRIFCGDLGNDVTDEVLQRTFGRYPSFQKAKVIRDKKSNKTKGKMIYIRVCARQTDRRSKYCMISDICVTFLRIWFRFIS